MKKLFALFLLLSAFSGALFSQGSLQFNQVLKVTSEQTIPTGKVWKLVSAPYKNDVVSIVGNYTQANPAVEFLQSITLDGNVVYVQSTRLYDGSWKNFTGPTCQFPLWLPAGTTVAAGIGVRFISVLEFNII